MSAQELITEHLGLWTSAITKKSTSGRGSNGKIELTGVKKLRELILELAVRGKLVDQSQEDEPIDLLFEKIMSEKSAQLKAKKIRKPKVLPEVQATEHPFPISESWRYCRLNELGIWGSGATPKRGNARYYGGDIPWFKSGELYKDFINSSEETITDLALQETSVRMNQPGDVLIAMYGATIGKASILEVAGTTNQAVCACTPWPGISNMFLLLLLKAYRSRFVAMGAGGAQPNISREKIIATVIGLPPEQEQHRIVKKVDELMALCDRLEQQTSDQLEAHETLVDTLLGTLTQSENATELADNWARLAAHFDTLFTTEQSIDKLKQAILQLAVMGRLVEQDGGEPAANLLTQIYTRKTALADDKRIKRPRPLTQLNDTQHSYPAPIHWAWTSFEDIADEISTGPFGSMIHKHDYVENGVPLINPSHMVNGEIKEDSSVSVTPAKAEKLSSYKVTKGDIVMARRGEVGRCAIVTDRESGWLCGTGSFVLRFHPTINRRFILLLFSTDTVRDYLTGNSVGTTMTNLNHGILKKMPVALPSTEEQNRIVQKVDELMTLCDKLKERLAHVSKTCCQLAAAVVKEAVA